MVRGHGSRSGRWRRWEGRSLVRVGNRSGRPLGCPPSLLPRWLRRGHGPVELGWWLCKLLLLTVALVSWGSLLAVLLGRL